MAATRALALVAIACAVLGASPARAAWLRAETDRFIVYGDGSERAVREYAQKLTTFDAVLRAYHPSTANRQSTTKVQVILLDSRTDLKRVWPRAGKYGAGVYMTTDEGIYAFALTDASLGADDVIFHEYAHHFMHENFPVAYPAWFVEGWAEYFMTADITNEGVTVGGYSPARAYGLFQESWLPWEEVLSRTTGETRPQKRNVFYSQAWLLTHYMISDRVRAAKLDKAIAAIAAGQEPLKAFQTEVGVDLVQLNKELRGYRKLPIATLKDAALRAPARITVTSLPRSAEDLLIDDMQMIVGSAPQGSPEFLEAVRRKAAKYPGDSFAEAVLARAEFTLGDVAAAEAIVKRRLEHDPYDKETLILAGSGLVIAGLRDPQMREQRFRAARPFLGKAYNLDKSDFRPLYAYAVSRSIEPGFPTENDLNVLLEARGLAPAVQEISFRAGAALIGRGRREEAAKILAAVANNPHGGSMALTAKALIEGKSFAEAEKAGEGAEAAPPTSPDAPRESPAK